MSSLLSAEELNDFIRPAVACIKPVEVDEGDGHLELEFEETLGIVSNKGKKLSRAQISLTDCLACSGCITSSEEVLIAQHNYTEFIEYHRANPDRIYALSLSHQVRASLANAFEVDLKVMDKVLMNVFREKFGFKYVVSVGIGRELLHREIYKEVEEIEDVKKPVLCGSCPGWMLYATKTQPELKSLLSRVKSPMSITGGLLKKVVGKEMYHLSVMPCFDKKLEGSGEENVDMVITPREVVSLFSDYNVDMDDEIARVEAKGSGNYKQWIDEVSPGVEWADGTSLRGWGRVKDAALDSSGGVASTYIARYAGEKGGKVETVVGRNGDVTELRAVVDEKVIRRVAVVNGFKNIQNLVRKLKSGGDKKIKARRVVRRRGEPKGGSTESTDGVDLSQCTLIEVNACPGGCINGGGLIAAPEGSKSSNKSGEWMDKVLGVYKSIPKEEREFLASNSYIDPSILLRPEAPESGNTEEALAARAKEADPSALLVSAW